MLANALLANVVLAVHFLIVAFIAGALPLVWLGGRLGWRWVANPWFRYLHLAAIAFVAAEALLGIACPLTVWEDLLRGAVQPDSFVARWVHRLIFHRAPQWAFTAVYVGWMIATLITLRLVPPRRRAG